ncbi:TonB-dependent receptor [Sphingomonas sp. dw_22]|uniref:TonB-dependent receptor domain-containing protein n=1 Tax=Sphingomonas sp. dw_22 TaxID=2721175 RepID=UPI001BD320AA|nr:TonB-dependent receptor [Sphingomonas sp. dw_22]
MKTFDRRHRTLLAAGAALSALCFTATAHAQTVPAAEQPQAEESADQAAQTEIIVTGSRIASPSLTSPSPLQAVTADDIAATGDVNIQTVLQRNPAFGTPSATRTNSNFSSTSAGLATINLRNMGSDRTLILVDGRRVVPGVPGSAAVDLNMIPTPFIERVDVLTGGASAVYGSDAVAGVVNFVYKKSFEGIEFNAQKGISERGDDAETVLNLTVGHNFDDGRGNIMFYAGYTDQGRVATADRARSAVDQTSTGNLIKKAGADDANLTAAQQLFDVTRPFNSSIAPQGTFQAGSQTFTYDASGNLKNSFNVNGGPGVAADGFNRAAYQSIAVPVERYVFAGRANYEVTDGISAFLEGTYVSTHSQSRIEPLPLQSAGSLGIFRSVPNGRFNIENYVANPGGGAPVLVRNPLVPDAIFNAATDTNGDGLRDMGFTQRLTQFGDNNQRVSTIDRQSFRIVGGFNGDLSDKWRFEAYFEYGQTTASQQTTGETNVINFADALNVVPDLYDINSNGNTTEAICASAEARARGCVPANIFGANKLSPEALAYLSSIRIRDSRQTQAVASGSVSGALFDLPAGAVQISVGGEYRRETSREIFDPLTNGGLNADVQLVNTAGSFEVTEGFGEIVIPLLKDKPFFHQLDLRGAGRVSHYSTVGTVYTYNGGVEWAPVSDIRLRGVYARAVRAPNIGELFGGATQTFPSGISDPCTGVTLTSTGALSDNCRAATGVLANIQANGSFTRAQSDIQGISGRELTNPNLGVERGTTYTIGAVINPASIHALRNLTLTVDYFHIKVDDAITRLPRQFILNGCYANADASLCSLIRRRPVAAGAFSAGSLELVDTTLNNSGGLNVSGIDVTAGYRQNLTDWGLGDGTADLRVSYSHLIDGYIVPLPGAAKDQFAGEIGTARDKAQVTLGYSDKNWGFSLNNTYIGKSYLDDQFRAQFVLGNGDLAPKNLFAVDAKIYTDLQIHFDPTEHSQFYIGVDNAFDVAPPPIVTGLPGSTQGTETAAGTYDPIGRRYYAGVRVKF